MSTIPSVMLAVLAETQLNETRVALDPTTAERFVQLGCQVVIAPAAGAKASFTDAQYTVKSTVQDPTLEQIDILLTVQPPSLDVVKRMKAGSVIIGYFAPHKQDALIRLLQERQITSFAMELVPRITRAQSMDALSSQAAIAGYKGAIMAADLAPVFFPMLTTAAGTIRPAKTVVIGAGVAGLQAIATARRLGSQVEAYDIRPAAKEQVESLGAKLIDTGIDASGEGGYARALTDEEKAQQATVLAAHLAKAHAVISTAALPGRDAPKIISREMVEQMRVGTVIIDLAADSGGNCELTQPGQTIVTDNGVTIHAPLNVAAQVPVHASEMYAKNLFNLLSPFIQEGQLQLDLDDDVLAGCVLTHAGEIKHVSTRDRLA